MPCCKMQCRCCVLHISRLRVQHIHLHAQEVKKLHATLGRADRTTNAHILTANLGRKMELIGTVNQDIATLMQLIGERDKQKKSLTF